MGSDGRTVDLDIIQNVARRAAILDVSIMHFSATSTRPLSGVDSASLCQEARFRAAQVTPTPDSILMSAVEFEFAAKDAAELCQVHGTVAVIYQLKMEGEPLPRLDVSHFCEVNAMYNSWPYIREIVGSSCARLGLTGVVLPLWLVPDRLPPEGEFTVLSTSPV